MAVYKMQPAVIAEQKADQEALTAEVKEFVSRVVNISEMNEQFWHDFMLGASMWGITAGFTGAW